MSRLESDSIKHQKNQQSTLQQTMSLHTVPGSYSGLADVQSEQTFGSAKR